MTADVPIINRDLLLRIAGGDEDAFKIFFEAFWPQVYGTSLRLTRLPEQAKDLSQEIFLRLWENREKLREIEKPEAYLYILSRNYIMDHLRKKVFDPSNLSFLISYFNSDVITPQQKMEFHELEACFREAIEKLPGKVKEVFRLSRLEGMTHEQIAAKLNISVVSSKTYIVRALQQIREHVAAQPEPVIILLVMCSFQFS